MDLAVEIVRSVRNSGILCRTLAIVRTCSVRHLMTCCTVTTAKRCWLYMSSCPNTSHLEDVRLDGCGHLRHLQAWASHPYACCAR